MRYGGFELKPSDYVRCVEAIAIGDASAAWCMNQGSGCSMTAAYLGAGGLAGDLGRQARCAGMGAGAGCESDPNGGRLALYRHLELSPVGLAPRDLAGRDVFLCFIADGSPVLRPDGRPWERTMLFRRELARIDDVWQVLGLRGTGSDNYTYRGSLRR